MQPSAPASKGLGTVLSIVAVVLSLVAVVASLAIPGPTGATGPAGTNGTNGTDGAQGPIGLTGPAGPGTRMAQNNTTASLVIATTCTHYTGINVTASGAGTVVVTTQVRVVISHTVGTADIVRVYVGVSATDCAYDAWRSYTSVGANAPTDVYYLTLTVQKPLAVAASGTYKFYVNGDMFSGSATADSFTGAGTIAVFYPS